MGKSTSSSIGSESRTPRSRPKLEAEVSKVQSTRSGRPRAHSVAGTLGETRRKLGTGIDPLLNGGRDTGRKVSENIGKLKEKLKESIPVNTRLAAGKKLKKVGISSKGLLTQAELKSFPEEAEAYLSATDAAAATSKPLARIKAKHAGAFIAQVLCASGASAALGAALVAIIVAMKSNAAGGTDGAGENERLPELDPSAAGFSELSDAKLQGSLEDLFSAVPEPTRSDAITTFKEAYNKAAPESRGVFIDTFVRECSIEYLSKLGDLQNQTPWYDEAGQLGGGQLHPAILETIQQKALGAAGRSATEAHSTSANARPEVATHYEALGAALGAIAGAGAGGLWAQTSRKNRKTIEREVDRRESLAQKAALEDLSAAERNAQRHLENKHELDTIDPKTAQRLRAAEQLYHLKQEHQGKLQLQRESQETLQLRIKEQKLEIAHATQQAKQRVAYLQECYPEGFKEILAQRKDPRIISSEISLALLEDKILSKLPEESREAVKAVALSNPKHLDACIDLYFDPSYIEQVFTRLPPDTQLYLFASILDAHNTTKAKFLLDLAQKHPKNFQILAQFTGEQPQLLHEILSHAMSPTRPPIEEIIQAMRSGTYTGAQADEPTQKEHKRASAFDAARSNSSFTSARSERPNSSFDSARSERPNSSFDSARSERSNSSFNSAGSGGPNSSFDSARSERPNSSFDSARSVRSNSSFDSARSVRSNSSFESARSVRSNSSFESAGSVRSNSSFDSAWKRFAPAFLAGGLLFGRREETPQTQLNQPGVGPADPPFVPDVLQFQPEALEVLSYAGNQSPTYLPLISAQHPSWLPSSVDFRRLRRPRRTDAPQ